MSRVCVQLGFALNFNTLEVEAAVRVNSKRRVLEAESQWSWMAFRRGAPSGPWGEHSTTANEWLPRSKCHSFRRRSSQGNQSRL